MDIRKKHTCLIKILLIFLIISITSSCPHFQTDDTSDIDFYYISGSKEDKEKFIELFRQLKNEEQGSESEFAVTREIAVSYARMKDYDRLIHFLSGRTINNSGDPYNSYYFMMIAFAFIQQGSEPIAALYFDMIVNNYPDLIINDESIHLVCLRNLINLNNRPEKQVWYYQELISRFPDKIDLGTTYFMLGQASELVGDWNGAIQAYTNYLHFSGTIIPGFPNADQYARQQVDFSRSPKDWTMESLPALTYAVQRALDEGNPWELMLYQAKVNFFARSWEQFENEGSRMAVSNIAMFMPGRIRYSPTLESSTATEAFLRTTGWSSISMQTWYLYFRKIYFPQNPEIHGRWEWAGIYYGEKF